MNNKDLILKTARRLDKFSLDDIIISSGIEEPIVNDILANLIKENIILKNNEIYFFNVKKNAVKTKKNEPEFALGNNIKSIIIEEQEGYDYFLNLSEETQNKIKRYVELINLVEKTGRKNIKNVVEFFNQTLSDKKIPYPTFSRFYNQYKRYGFKGLLPYRTENFESSIPDELYTCFKKYFLYGDRLVMTKSGSTMRKLKIEENVCTFLKNKFDEIKPNGDDFVFTIDNAPFTQLYFDENVLIPLSKELGIEKLNPSDLQHNFVNMCIKQNVPLTYIQKSIGSYGIVNFVRIYNKLIEQMEDKVYNPLEKI